jgi:hypothetical protein
MSEEERNTKLAEKKKLIAFLATELSLAKEEVQDLQSQLEAREVLLHSLLTTFPVHVCIYTALCLKVCTYRLPYASKGGIVLTARALRASAVNMIPTERGV